MMDTTSTTPALDITALGCEFRMLHDFVTGRDRGLWSNLEEYSHFISEHLPHVVSLPKAVATNEIMAWAKDTMRGLWELGFDLKRSSGWRRTDTPTRTFAYHFSDAADAVAFKLAWG